MSIDEVNAQSQELNDTPDAKTPGQYLREEREGRNLTQKDVADKLHITIHYVNSIESDAYEKLPGTVFAKGYIKRYAEILEVDVAATLGRFEDYLQSQQHQENEVTRISKRKTQARNRNFAIVSIILFIGLFTALWAWNRVAEPVAELSANAPVETDNVSASSAPAIPNQQNTPAVAEITAAPNTTAPEANSLSTDASTTAATTIERAPAPEIDQPALPDENAELRVVAVTNEGSDVLRVSFTDESFIQVSDADANRIYRGTLGRGDVLEITDSAPFTVLIGDAPLTRLTLNGNEIDVSSSIRIDNSARLTVGL